MSQRFRVRVVVRCCIHARSPHGSCAESVSWRVSDVQRAASHFGRVLKFHSNVIAWRPPVSVSVGGAGSRPSARVISPIKTISHAHSEPGGNAILTTGANTAAPIQSIPIETANSNASATTGGASALLQRWTCQNRLLQFPQAYTRSAKRRRPELQRWTRGRCKSLCFQAHTISREYCKEMT